VSVIIPTYNRPKQLLEAVNSVLAQSCRPDEIIVVNDGAYHDSLEKLKEYGILVHNNPKPLGGNFSRNKGVELSSGDILMFLDDDDVWHPHKVARQLEVFSGDSNIGLVYTNRNVVDDDRRPIRKITAEQSGQLFPEILFSNIIGTTSSVAIKRSVFLTAGGFDTELPALQDYDLWIRACRITTVGLVQECLVDYTVSKQNGKQVSKSGDKQYQAVNRMLAKYKLDIDSLGKLRKKRVLANFLFYVAKSYKDRSYLCSIKYATKSIMAFPSLRAIALFLPNRILRVVRN